MTRIERRLLREILARSGGLTIAAFWLVFTASLSRATGVTGDDLGLASIANAASSGFASMDAAATLCAPIGTLLAVGWLRRTGVLASAMAAGLRPVRLARVLAAAGAITVLFVVAAQAPTYEPAELDLPGDLRQSGDVFAWCPPSAAGRVVVFRADTLDVSVAPDRATAIGRAPLTPLFGSPVSMSTAGPGKSAGGPLRTPAIAQAIMRRRSIGTVLAAADRVLLGGCLVLLAGLVALVVPQRRFWLAYLGLTGILAVSAVAIVTLSVQLWLGGTPGIVAQVVCVALAGAGVATLFQRFSRRGLHIG